MEDISIEKLQLIWSIIITAVIPSILWIIRKPLRELIKLGIKLFGGEMWLERFENFEYVGTERGCKGEGKECVELNYLIYKNKHGYYKCVIVDIDDNTILNGKVYKTLNSCKIHTLRGYTLYKGDIFDFF